MKTEIPRLGAAVRTLRRRHRLTQAAMAERLGISASYLNLIEHDRRPVSTRLLIRLAQDFQLDVKELGGGNQERLVGELLEVFGDTLFDGQALTPGDVRDLAVNSPAVGMALLRLYRAYREVRGSARTLAEQVSAGVDLQDVAGFHLPSEEVSDFIQHHMNYSAELEDGAERLRQEAHLDREDLWQGLVRFLSDTHGVEVRVEKVGLMKGALRRFDPGRRLLLLSEVLRRGSRNFQLAHQVGLLTQSEVLDKLSRDPILTTDVSRALCRAALANYFAAAVLMPYEPFLKACREERYDLELLGHRFRTSFEQICHRVTTLRRPEAEGVPFHLLRIDVAGNISKRFSASGIRIARFSGACPRWNVHSAFLTPGMIRVQLSQMPDGTTYFCIARTVLKDSGGYHAPHTIQAIGLGCEMRYARDLVYADGVDLGNLTAVVPVGITCRLCERMDCEQRVFPPLDAALKVDENVRGVSFYAPVEG
jgi:predicted transcriptional regulator/DNA-binding XRE family transcriptional regulator